MGGVGLNKGFGGSTKKNTESSAVNNLELLMNRFLKGEFDLIGVGRSILNDPNWVKRARRNEAFLPFDPANLARLT